VSKKKRQDAEDAAPPASDGVVRVGSHPRAQASIRRLRGRAGIVAFAVCLLLSLNAGLPLFDSVARGLAAGVVAHFVAWFAGVAVWRHLILGELLAHEEALAAAREERRAAAEAANAA